MEYTPVTPTQVAAAEGLDDWRVLLRSLHAEFRAPSFPAAAAFVVAIAAAAEQLDHHPNLDVRPSGHVRVSVSTHATGGLTTADIHLALAVSTLAKEHGAVSDPAPLTALEIAIDTMDAARIRPFWAAVLGYRESNGDLVDPRRIGPPVWFQQMDQPRSGRGRVHLDVTVPHDQAEARVAATVAAGGHIVSDAHARAWWVLADAEGNEACISTWQDRA
jgi:4a-hydroxytetrahydrobiopterin dehydratase